MRLPLALRATGGHDYVQMRVRPFRGYTPTASSVERVVCVPYDVVDREEAEALAAGNPSSLLHVDRAEINFPANQDPYAPEVYAKAKEKFSDLIASGQLVREPVPMFYLYRLTMGTHQQTGIAATVLARDYEIGLIKKHEKTRPEKENDRTRLIDTLNAQTGPIILAFRSNPEIDSIISEGVLKSPDYDLTAPDGIRHEVWRVPGKVPLESAFYSVEAFYIADGHHRAASAARVAGLRRATNSDADAPHEGILSVLFPSQSLKVLPYNRVVRTLNGRSPEEFLDAVAKVVSLSSSGAQPEPPSARMASMFLQGKWYSLSWDLPTSAGPVDSLDVSVLQNRILAPLLGIDDPRRSLNIDFVGGIRGTAELEQRVNSGAWAVAFSMFPTTVEEVIAIADAGEIMPPKSTWFEPKLRSGFFIHALE